MLSQVFSGEDMSCDVSTRWLSLVQVR